MTVTKSITVQLPWAAAIRAGVKLVENRGRPTSYRGPVAIHAAASWSKTGEADERIRGWWWGPGHAGRPFDATDFTRMFRNIVAVADLTDCHQATLNPHGVLCCTPWGERWYNAAPAWHLVLANVRVLDTPVPARGQIGVPWNLPADVARQVNAQLVGANQ